VNVVTQDHYRFIRLVLQERLDLFDHHTSGFGDFQYDPEHPHSLAGKRVRSIFEEHGGRLWMATDSRPNERGSTSDAFVRYSHDPAQSSSISGNRATANFPDANGFVRLITNRGLSRINRQEGTASYFDLFNGLKGEEFNFGARLKTNAGQLLVGGTDGLDTLDSERLRVNTHRPDVVLSAQSKGTSNWRRSTVTRRRMQRPSSSAIRMTLSYSGSPHWIMPYRTRTATDTGLKGLTTTGSNPDKAGPPLTEASLPGTIPLRWKFPTMTLSGMSRESLSACMSTLRPGGPTGPIRSIQFSLVARLSATIDLDGFKLINDSYGHDAGDRVLIQVRDVLESSCRWADTIVRWGGDEFMIVGDHTSARAAERLRCELSERQYQLGDGHVGRLSGSIGFAMYPFTPLKETGLLQWEQVVALADHAAYAAKENGRNAWVGVYGTRKSICTEFTKNKIDLARLAKQRMINIRSPLDVVEVFAQQARQSES